MRYRLLSIPVTFLAVALAHFLKTPNPMMILIIPVVFFCYSDGYIGGALSGAVAILYSLYFFSNPGQLFTYNELNVQKVMTIVAAVAAIVILVGRLKQRDAAAIEAREAHVREMTRVNMELDKAVNEARNASKAKSMFLSSVSHDIRTPMNVILGMTTLAQDEVGNPEAVADYLAKINSSANFLLGLINDVLDMSKIESGKLEFRLESYAFRTFLNDIEVMCKPLCEQKHINLIIESHPDMNDVVMMVDKVRFKQVFLNLLSNAVKFTPEYGEIYFLTVTDKGKCGEDLLPCSFTVRDTGVGMSPAFQEKMFETFTQESSRYARKVQGTGLGLPIVKNIIDSMGGNISVQSAEGEGTTFTIELNLLMTQILPEDEGEATVSDLDFEEILGGKNVLVAEDNPLNMKVTSTFLKKKGVVVSCAENGLEAVKEFEDSPEGFFSAILMDVQMPDMDGLEAARRIRALTRGDARSVPIVAMTANAFGEDVERSIQSGMNKHLTKPTTPAALYSTLAHLIT
ncbi:hybrid sensor histidine kinase/response regulator [Deltaproteobacteria bacterium Smac51]|nr:hybrid sensor histidine kinase/response regulator [Deltaproteobacteria bacterium Smac51]